MVFRQAWVIIAVLVTLVGIGTRQPPVAAMGILVLLTGGLARAWNRLALERLEYQRTPSHRRMFTGETLDVRFSAVNRKVLPVPWLEIMDNVPEAMPVQDSHVSPSSWSGMVTLSRETSLAWYQRVSWTGRFECRQRGYFHFGPASLRSGDPFGFFESRQEVRAQDYVTVLPRLYDLSALGLPTRRPFGEDRGGAPIFEDPSRLIGIRDYRPGDPLKRIEWKATARRGTLQSRVYEPSSSLHLLIALNVSTLEYVWEGYDPVKLERCISLAGSVARWGHEHRFATGLIANSSYPGSDRAMAIPAGRDPEQLTRILEALAMVSPLTIAALEDVLDDAARRLPIGATIVIIAAFAHPRLVGAIQRLQGKGYPLAVLWAADEPPPEALATLNLFDLAARLRELERSSGMAFARPGKGDAESAPIDRG